MPKKKRESSKQTNVRVGNVSDVSGNVNVAGGNITTHHTTTGLSAEDIKQLFGQVYSAIENRAETPTADKEDLKTEVKEIQSMVTEAARTKTKVPEGVLSRHFRNIARMAPDVLDMAVAAAGHPSLGLGAAVKEIAEKAKQETSTL